MRTSIKTLETLCQWINERTGSPLTPWSKDEQGRNTANVGNYHLSGAYGGVCLHRMHNTSGGVTTPLVSSHVPKRELEIAMRAFLSGLETPELRVTPHRSRPHGRGRRDGTSQPEQRTKPN